MTSLLTLVPNTICHNFICKLNPIHVIKLFTEAILFRLRGNYLFCNIFSGIKQSIFQATETKSILVMLNTFYCSCIRMEIIDFRFFGNFNENMKKTIGVAFTMNLSLKHLVVKSFYVVLKSV